MVPMATYGRKSSIPCTESLNKYQKPCSQSKTKENKKTRTITARVSCFSHLLPFPSSAIQPHEPNELLALLLPAMFQACPPHNTGSSSKQDRHRLQRMYAKIILHPLKYLESQQRSTEHFSCRTSSAGIPRGYRQSSELPSPSLPFLRRVPISRKSSLSS
jgi:hypothetical protein